MPPLCDGSNLSSALETPTLCNEGSSWSNNMIAITFVLTRMFLHLATVTLSACPCSGNIFIAIRLRKQNSEGKSFSKRKKKKTHILFKERRGKSELMLGPTRQALRLSNRARLSEVIMSSEDKQGALVWSVTCAAFPDASQTLYSYVVFDEL